MSKIATVKLGWKKSPSADIDRVELIVLKDGTETTTRLGPEVEEFLIEVQASTGVSFRIDTFDTEGYKAASEIYSFMLGDLEDPQPATELYHEVVSVREL